MVAVDSLQPIVGLRLTRATLAVDQRILHFGALVAVPLMSGPRKGHTALVGSHAIYLRCAWRFLRDGAVLTGSEDINRYAGENKPPRWTFHDGNSVQHVNLPAIVAAEPRVRSAHVNPASGDIVVTFEGDPELLFETFTSSSRGEEWMFFEPASEREALVFRSDA